jgi:hypothetical protein
MQVLSLWVIPWQNEHDRQRIYFQPSLAVLRDFQARACPSQAPFSIVIYQSLPQKLQKT